MEPNTPDWEISKLYSRAWEVVKKNKLLWIFGLAAAGGGFNYNNSGNFDSKDFEKFFQNTPTPPTTPETFNNVLGAATSSPFLESIKGIFGAIPFNIYILLGVELLVLVLIGIIINLIYSAWAQGLLLQGTMDGADDKKVSIEDASQKVFPKIKPLVWLQIVPFLIFGFATALVFGVLVLAITLTSGATKIIPIILIVVAFGAFIYWFLHLIMAQIWAPRQVLFEDKKGKEAFFSGLKVAKKKFWASLLLGIVNNILSVFVILIPIAIFGGLLLGSFFGVKAIPGLTIVLVIIGTPLLVAAIIGFMLLGGVLNAFKAVVWTLAYKQIKGRYDS